MRNAFLTYFWRENSNNFIFRAKRDENHRPKQNLNGPKTWFIHFPIGLEKAVLLIPSGREKAFTQCHQSRTDALLRRILIAIVGSSCTKWTNLTVSTIGCLLMAKTYLLQQKYFVYPF